ncbi:uncharacterized protein PAC_06150 [Phialocephala subalpina]|uniref:Uncharacterized protein n=1 Tax=Phialocephala subalpina TaxID=576137 RepID=A0A1L7WU14_9HELO|nr:uncharacterized protein PAC_06150 [Phialocephala subalpina]
MGLFSDQNATGGTEARRGCAKIEEFGFDKDLKDRGVFGAVEVLYRHNLLWARAQLFKQFLARREWRDRADEKAKSASGVSGVQSIRSSYRFRIGCSDVDNDLASDEIDELLTTSIFVLVVAVVLAWLMETAEPKDITSATVAYAAVLVMFVGTGTLTPAAGWQEDARELFEWSCGMTKWMRLPVEVDKDSN